MTAGLVPAQTDRGLSRQPPLVRFRPTDRFSPHGTSGTAQTDAPSCIEIRVRAVANIEVNSKAPYQ